MQAQFKQIAAFVLPMLPGELFTVSSEWKSFVELKSAKGETLIVYMPRFNSFADMFAEIFERIGLDEGKTAEFSVINGTPSLIARLQQAMPKAETPKYSVMVPQFTSEDVKNLRLKWTEETANKPEMVSDEQIAFDLNTALYNKCQTQDKNVDKPQKPG